MPSIQDHSAVLADAAKLPADQILTPRIPAGIYLQEAENLYQNAVADKDELIGAGLSEKTITSLPLLASACRETQSIWNREHNAHQAAEQKWADQSHEGYALRDRLEHAFSFAFRADEALMKKVHAIRAGRGHADMIQDLSDLAVLGRANTALLAAIRLDLAELDRAQELASWLAELLAMANGERLSDNKSKIMRDRTYTLLKHAVDEIYACGRYIFWNDEKRLKMYRSAYRHHQRTSGSPSRDDK